MKLTIFAKKKHTKEGKEFFTYLTTLTKSDGSTLSCAVKFSEDIGNPKPVDCPMIIELDKADCNLSTRKYKDSDGVENFAHTLWINKYSKTGEQFVDHSMDDFV